MLSNHSKTQWLNTINTYYCLKVYRPVGKFWSGPGLASLSWICLCIHNQLVDQMGDGWSRMASRMCLMNHYLMTEWHSAKSLSSFGWMAQTHSHGRWEGLQEGRDTKKASGNVCAKLAYGHFHHILVVKTSCKQVQIQGMGERRSSLDVRSCEVTLQSVWI